MQKLTVNIVAFDIPYPAIYGGTIDIFYKLRTLKKTGVNIILHCFEYNKPKQQELEKYCKQVFYYPRKKGLRYIFSKLPYIVITRSNRDLIENLKANNNPILFEGLHSCFFLNSEKLKNRRKIVRMHNIEHDYYRGLQKASKSFLNKFYYFLESYKLKRFESVLKTADAIICISNGDQKYFAEKYKNVHYIPAFHPFKEVVARLGKGNYFLYHGNLSVEENIVAANFLLDHVFNKTEEKLVIAGKNPGNTLAKKIKKNHHAELVANPSIQRMDELLKKAQGCVLPTFQGTGLKLKLLVSLYSSRFVIANNLMVENTSLENMCELVDSPEEFIETINKIAKQEFNQEQLDERTEKLRLFNNERNGARLIQIISSL